ncbi:hypothetical protein ACJJTC_018538 [Scirpophaga incertulas]
MKLEVDAARGTDSRGVEVRNSLSSCVQKLCCDSCNVDSICVNASCVNVRLPGLVSPPSWLLAVSRLLERGIVGVGNLKFINKQEEATRVSENGNKRRKYGDHGELVELVAGELGLSDAGLVKTTSCTLSWRGERSLQSLAEIKKLYGLKAFIYKDLPDLEGFTHELDEI